MQDLYAKRQIEALQIAGLPSEAAERVRQTQFKTGEGYEFWPYLPSAQEGVSRTETEYTQGSRKAQDYCRRPTAEELGK